METQDVTITLPTHLLQKAEQLAAERGASLSSLLTELITSLVIAEGKYVRARQRHIGWLTNSADLGTNGEAAWTRKDLHER